MQGPHSSPPRLLNALSQAAAPLRRYPGRPALGAGQCAPRQLRLLLLSAQLGTRTAATSAGVNFAAATAAATAAGGTAAAVTGDAIIGDNATGDTIIGDAIVGDNATSDTITSDAVTAVCRVPAGIGEDVGAVERHAGGQAAAGEEILNGALKAPGRCVLRWFAQLGVSVGEEGGQEGEGREGCV